MELGLSQYCAQKFAKDASKNFLLCFQCSYYACIMLLSYQQFLTLSWEFKALNALLEYFTTR